MNGYLEALIRLIYPAICGVCESLLELGEEGICRACEEGLRNLKFPLEETSLDIRSESLDEGWALYPYESPVKEIIGAIKFLKKRWLIRIFRDEIKSFMLTLAGENDYDFLVPIPLDREKLAEREFNQSELISHLIRRTGGIPVRTDILRKRHKTSSQSLLSREERRFNLHGVFGVCSRRHINGKSILLVDDIYTTGATAEEAARTLKYHGAKRIGLFALARTELDAESEAPIDIFTKRKFSCAERSTGITNALKNWSRVESNPRCAPQTERIF
ncbi:MAG: ComF family protein [Candidatus Omnitrophica bacterium]|nr:ComF family protein [Candidatus Omnitrophota bacterium]